MLEIKNGRAEVKSDEELQSIMKDVAKKTLDFLYCEVTSHSELKPHEQFLVQYEVTRAIWSQLQKDGRKYNIVRRKIK